MGEKMMEAKLCEDSFDVNDTSLLVSLLDSHGASIHDEWRWEQKMFCVGPISEDREVAEKVDLWLKSDDGARARAGWQWVEGQWYSEEGSAYCLFRRERFQKKAFPVGYIPADY